MSIELINGGLPFVGSAASSVGLPRAAVRALIQTQRVRRVFRGVYVDVTVPDTRSVRAMALHLVKPPDAVFYGATVAFLLGVDAYPPKDRFTFRPECVVPHHTSRCLQRSVRCKEGYLPAHDLVEVEGLVVTTPVRTTCDMLRSLWRPHAMAAADAMAHAGLVSRGEVTTYISRLKRYPGIVQARALAPLIDPLSESAGESWQRLRLVDAGFPVPLSQFEVFDRFGQPVARLDHAYDGLRVGIEYDGREWHDDERGRSRDAAKREYLCDGMGWRLAVGRQTNVFGEDHSFEQEIGSWIGITPLPRRW